LDIVPSGTTLWKMNPLLRDRRRHSHRPRQKMPKELKLDLLNNGIDFVRSSLEYLYFDEHPEPQHYKYAVLHVFSGALLILKQRLASAHSALVWKEVSDHGNFAKPTVGFDDLITRLRTCANVVIKDEDVRRLRAVQQLRNRIEHSEVTLDLSVAKEHVAELVQFLFEFLRQELGESLEDHMPYEIRERLTELRKVADRLGVERKERQEKRERDWRDRAKCYETMSEEELTSILDPDTQDNELSDTPEPLECPACGDYSVVVVGPEMGICKSMECREPTPVTGCPRCSAHYMTGFEADGPDDVDYCEACWAELSDRASRDD
jgi:hypothetical protein